MNNYWLLKAIHHCGSQKELARRMGIHPERISYMVNYARKISLECALLIEKATQGVIHHRHLLLRSQLRDLKSREEKTEKIDSYAAIQGLSISARAELGMTYEKTLGRRKRAKNNTAKWENFPTLPIRREELAAKYVQFRNYRTYRQAKQVAQRGSPELIQAMDEQRVAISTAAALLRYSLSEQRGILSLSHKEIIGYAKRSLKKRNSLSQAAMPMWSVTLFLALMARKNEVSDLYLNKESTHGSNKNCEA